MSLSIEPVAGRRTHRALVTPPALAALVEAAAPPGDFDVRTLRSDASRATIQVSGDLDADGAAVLARLGG